MKYDMSIKRAQRMLRKSWADLQREAHALGALGGPLEVRVEPEHVRLILYPQHFSRGLEVTIYEDGRIEGDLLVQWQDGHWEVDERRWYTGAGAVVQVLSWALQEAQARAEAMENARAEISCSVEDGQK